jgi:hypothetical protein
MKTERDPFSETFSSYLELRTMDEVQKTGDYEQTQV